MWKDPKKETPAIGQYFIAIDHEENKFFGVYSDTFLSFIDFPHGPIVRWCAAFTDWHSYIRDEFGNIYSVDAFEKDEDPIKLDSTTQEQSFRS